MPLILSGDTGPSFVQSAAMPAGSVIQTVTSSSTTNYTSTSASFTDTTFFQNITPQSATNKVLITVVLNGAYTSTGGRGAQFTIYRNNATNLGAGGNTFNCLGFSQVNGTNGLYSTVTMSFLDSPATTSSTKYSVYYAIEGGATVGINSVGTSIITLQEIKA